MTVWLYDHVKMRFSDSIGFDMIWFDLTWFDMVLTFDVWYDMIRMIFWILSFNIRVSYLFDLCALKREGEHDNEVRRTHEMTST